MREFAEFGRRRVFGSRQLHHDESERGRETRGGEVDGEAVDGHDSQDGVFAPSGPVERVGGVEGGWGNEGDMVVFLVLCEKKVSFGGVWLVELGPDKKEGKVRSGRLWLMTYQSTSPSQEVRLQQLVAWLDRTHISIETCLQTQLRCNLSSSSW